jgi:hypothetical protein
VIAALSALVILGVLGAFDTLVYHEAVVRLPSKASARGELRLHAARDFVYAVLFGGFAWFRFEGGYTFVVAALLATEIAITLADFITEDRTRKLPAGERSMHAVMGIVYGVFLALLVPSLYAWSKLPTGLERASYGALSYVMTLLSIGVFGSGVRDVIASRTLGSAAAATLPHRLIQ